VSCSSGADSSNDADFGRYLYPICKDPMPMRFSNPDEASLHLEVITAKIFDFFDDLYIHTREILSRHRDLDAVNDDTQGLLIRASLRSLDLDSSLAEGVEDCHRNLDAWMLAFSGVSQTPSNRLSHISAQIFYFCVWIWSKTWLDTTSMLVDRFEPQFEYFTGLCEQYVELHLAKTPLRSGFSARGNGVGHERSDTPPAFSLGSGVVTCLVVIVEKCRTSSIRRRCIATLRKINLQGVFDTDYLVAYLSAVVEHEEQVAQLFNLDDDLKTDFGAHEIPEAARFLEVLMLPTYHCSDFDFYKAGWVSFIYVTNIGGGLRGELQVGERSVRVLRANTANAPALRP
jgi:hypothetical protein